MTEKEKWDNLIKGLEMLRDRGETIVDFYVENDIRETSTITGEYNLDVIGKTIRLYITNGRNKK